MPHCNVTVDAVKFFGMILVIQVGFPPFLRQSQGEIVLVAMDTRGFIRMSLCILDLGFGFPVKAFGILKEFAPYIPHPGFDFLCQIPFSMGREVAIHTVDVDPTFVVVVGRKFPALRAVRVDVARGAKFIGGGCGDRFTSKEDDKGSDYGSSEEGPPCSFSSF
jgi:hypothetical protein